ncbi:MAG: hypothetical protein ACSHWZ_14450 [Sulfitobacter sp.]
MAWAMMCRRLFHIFLCLTLLLTAQSVAAQRGASAATGQMVICTGTGVMAVFVDAQGQPTTAPHICPDAAFQVPCEAHAPMAVMVRRAARTVLSAAPGRAQIRARDVARPRSRAPPLAV